MTPKLYSIKILAPYMHDPVPMGMVSLALEELCYQKQN